MAKTEVKKSQNLTIFQNAKFKCKILTGINGAGVACHTSKEGLILLLFFSEDRIPIGPWMRKLWPHLWLTDFCTEIFFCIFHP